MRQPVFHVRTEAEYFYQVDLELIDGLRRHAAREQRRHRLEEASHIHTPAILQALDSLGYDETTVMLLFVVPLVQVAWADGSVNHSERDHIVAVASLRGLYDGMPAFERLMGWLEQRPPDDFFEGTLGVIQAVFSSLPAAERKACKDALLLCCRDTAAAPCHILGWARVCAAKRKAIEEIERRLERPPSALD